MGGGGGGSLGDGRFRGNLGGGVCGGPPGATDDFGRA